MEKRSRLVRAAALAAAFSILVWPMEADAATRKKKTKKSRPEVTAQAYVIMDAKSGQILQGRSPHKKLPPASTTKVMTALLALEYLPMDYPVPVSRRSVNVSPSKAGLTLGATYAARDLIKACLVASSNDAAVALAEAVSGTEPKFAVLMNEKAAKLGMSNTKFVNASGLTDKKKKQYTTAYDLARLMRHAIKDKRIDEMMGVVDFSIRGSDGKVLPLRAHNKMLWKKPKFVKGKTGWTYASKHTFVGTNYRSSKSMTFAILASQKPWADIERLASLGVALTG